MAERVPGRGAEAPPRGRGGDRLLVRLAGAGEELSRGAPLLLLLDLDGTLAHFRVDPTRVRLSGRWRALLQSMVRGGARVVIVTGRRARQAHGIVGVDGVEVVGLHGAERLTRARRLSTGPVSSRALRALDHLLEEARRLASRLPGSRVEDKRPGGVALHTRGADQALAAGAERLFSARIRASRAQGVAVLKGKRMVEARARGAHKGTAALSLFREARRGGKHPVVFFAGDDVTDEDAFRALKGIRGSIAVLVAERPRRSAARFRVAHSQALYRLLSRLACYLPRPRAR